jgi:hypothetical protein
VVVNGNLLIDGQAEMNRSFAARRDETLPLHALPALTDPQRKAVKECIIEWSLKNRFLVLCGALMLIALGCVGVAVFKTPVDAIPDLTENQVLVYADWMGRSPQEVEDQVTFPLSTGLQGLAGVKDVRATSMFGFSLITIIFEEGMDTYFARTRVLERLNYLQGQHARRREAATRPGRHGPRLGLSILPRR